MPHIPSKIPNGTASKSASSSPFVPWPNLDDLYDYIAYMQSNPTLGSAPAATPEAPVVIIGAGAAGMVAAYELLKAGIVPLVLEASDRIGGRNWSRTFADDPNAIAEMGAMRFPPSGEVLFQYFKEFNIALGGTFPDPGKVPTQLYYEDQAYTWQPGTPPPGPFAQINTDWGNFITPIVNKIQTPWQAGQLDVVQQIWQSYITQYKDVSFYQALTAGIPQWGEEQFNAFGALGVGSGGFGPLYEISFLELLRIIINGWEDNQAFLPNGISELTRCFYTTEVTMPNGEKTSLAHKKAVKFNACVVGITGGVGSSPQVQYMLNGVRQTQTASAVIVATTTRSMEIMGMTLPQSATVNQNVKKSIRNVHSTNSSKMFVRTPTKFWKADPTIPQTIQTDELPRGVYALDYPGTDSGVVLVSYTWEDDSSKLLAMDPRSRFELFRDIIVAICPAFGNNLYGINLDKDLLNVDWEAMPNYFGAFKLNYPGQDVEVQTAYYQFLTALDTTQDTGVYLAGDGVSWSGGWTEGAMHTGINAACAALVHIGGTVYAQSPMTQKPLYTYS
jgi:tryptophan 2-monooxygenase